MDNNTTPVTPDVIAALSDEERAQLKKDVVKALAKNILRKTAITAVVAVGAHLAIKRLETKAAENQALEAAEIVTEA